MKKNEVKKVNKSALIRDFRKGNPVASPKEIAAAMLANHGQTVSAQFVSTVLTVAKKKGLKRGRVTVTRRKKISAGVAVALRLAGKLQMICDRLGLQPANVLKAVEILKA